VLRITNSIISGSAALHVLLSTAWSPSDLDVYAPHHSYKQVISYLRDAENYQVMESPDPSKYPYRGNGFSSVTHLFRDGHEIDVIQSPTRSALHPLPHFWATHVMNYISADAYCVAYPRYTLTERGILNPIHLVQLQFPPPTTLSNIAKYTTRRFDFRISP
ncbi:hypothetical protein FKP32DRAFT_1544252, partial [Trametes sanguinea]